MLRFYFLCVERVQWPLAPVNMRLWVLSGMDNFCPIIGVLLRVFVLLLLALTP